MGNSLQSCFSSRKYGVYQKVEGHPHQNKQYSNEYVPMIKNEIKEARATYYSLSIPENIQYKI